MVSRRNAIDKALKDGKADARHLMSDYAYVYKDDTTPLLGMGRTGGYEAAESTNEYFTFTVTVLEEDRDGDVVNPAGIQLKNYSRNPLWFFGHQEWLVPIGTSRSPDGRICVFPDVNQAKARFYPDTGDEDAMFIAGKISRGILSATSIAFVPIKAWKREEQRKAHQHESGMSGWFFDEIDLTEISVVGVPSNPYATIDQKNMRGALRDAVDKEGKSIRPRLRKALEQYCAKSTNESGGCWTGWCPCPPKVEKAMPKQVQKSAVVAHKSCGCKVTCVCKSKGKQPMAKFITINGVRYKAMDEGTGTAGGYVAEKGDVMSDKATKLGLEPDGRKIKIQGKASEFTWLEALRKIERGEAEVVDGHTIRLTSEPGTGYGKSHRCTFCKGSGNGCGRNGDCPDCSGRGVVRMKGTYNKVGNAKYSNNQPVVVVSEGKRMPGTVVSVEGTDGDYYYRVKLNNGQQVTAEEWQVQSKSMKRKDLTDEGNPEIKSEDESNPALLPHQEMMAHLYNQAKAEGDWLNEKMEGVTPFDPTTGEANKAHGALKEYQDGVGQRMESLKSMFGEHGGGDIDEAVKGLETSDTSNTEVGEANLVDRGEVPPVEMDETNDVEMDLPMEDEQTMDEDAAVEMDDDNAVEMSDDDDVTKSTESSDPDKGEILERYADGKGYKSRKASAARVAKVLGAGGSVRKGADGRRWLVAKVATIDQVKSILASKGIDVNQVGQGYAGIVILCPGKRREVLQALRAEGMSVTQGYEQVTVKSIQHRKSTTDTTEYPRGDDGDLTNEGNPAELKDEDRETVKSCGNMLKGLAAAHDMPEHHKSALDMHGDALHKSMDEGGASEAIGKAVKHMKSLAAAPDLEEHHKDALNFHAKAMSKCMKSMGAEEPAEAKAEEGDETKALDDEGNPVEVGKSEEEQKKLAFAYERMMRVAGRALNGVN